jgi:hypothetical protein
MHKNPLLQDALTESSALAQATSLENELSTRNWPPLLCKSLHPRTNYQRPASASAVAAAAVGEEAPPRRSTAAQAEAHSLLSAVAVAVAVSLPDEQWRRQLLGHVPCPPGRHQLGPPPDSTSTESRSATATARMNAWWNAGGTSSCTRAHGAAAL